MAKIKLSSVFKEHFRRRANKKVMQRYRERLALFLKNPFDPLLDTHPLKYDLEECFSFRLTDDRGTDDNRVIFKKVKGGYLFVDFGTHDQVYRRWRQGTMKGSHRL